MTPTTPPTTTTEAPASRDEIMASLFASMVMQQAQMALMLLGQMPHPETGETITDLEGAQMFIDQLEMLEVKTQGNLGNDEQQLLKQSLLSTRLAFVACIERQEKTGQPIAPVASALPAAPAASVPAPASEAASAAVDDESRKKFSKKY